jgi:hypothetical protein
MERRGKMRNRSFVVLLCAGLLATLGSPGLADKTGFRDENDAYGPLDVKRMWHGHGTDGGDLVHLVTTYGRWQAKTLESADSDIQVLFTTDADNKPERVLVIDEHNGSVRAEMHKWTKGIGKKTYGRAAVQRTGPRAVRVIFETSLLGRNVAEYGWHVDTRFHDEDHSRCNVSDGVIVVCPDSAPDDNSPRSYLRHKL